MSNNSNNPSKTSNTETTNAYNSNHIANPPNLDINIYFDYDSLDSIEKNRNRSLSPIRGQSRERSTNQNQTRRQNDRPQLNNAGYEQEILKQNRYLYLLVKELRRDVKEIKDELKRLRKEKESDLSPQVLDLLAKMKNYQGAACQNVRNSIWKVFGVEKLPLLKSNTGASGIVRWKQSVEVADCFCSLFVQNESGAYWIDLIARNAFSTAAVPTLTHDHCAFTLAVCDIILNPQSRSV
ncbi:hypothetical protein C2G38_2050450 [Gigaspora rosea]|uniref:Uncharacterized protein n=1 Tax=Gigaspora rosea TaxID=44941 RepID=A0A397TYC6_9GLOM|nr:hypothetical protein C2G38_2050450 [Gigaspora rosea]